MAYIWMGALFNWLYAIDACCEAISLRAHGSTIAVLGAVLSASEE